MKLKDRIKTYNFWVSLSSAIFLLLKVLGGQFGFNVSESLFSDIVTSLCGILVILGIIVPPTSKINFTQTQSDASKTEIKEEDFTSIETQISLEKDDEFVLEFKPTSNQNVSEIQDLKNDNCETSEIVSETENNNEQKSEIQNECIEIPSLDIDELKSKTADVLLNYESLFESNREEYIELLQNQINITQGK